MRRERWVTTEEPIAVMEDENDGKAETPIERDPFLVALMEEVEEAIATEEAPEQNSPAQSLPARPAQTLPTPSPAPTRRELARYNLD